MADYTTDFGNVVKDALIFLLHSELCAIIKDTQKVQVRNLCLNWGKYSSGATVPCEQSLLDILARRRKERRLPKSCIYLFEHARRLPGYILVQRRQRH